jgi:hypothetical protein
MSSPVADLVSLLDAKPYGGAQNAQRMMIVNQVLVSAKVQMVAPC